MPDLATKTRPVSWLSGIRTRLFLSLALFATVLTLVLSFSIDRVARRELEAELTSKLYAVGGIAVFELKPTVIPGLLAFTSAQKGFRTYRDAVRDLTQLRDLTGVSRIFLADPEGRSYVDTDERVGIGTPLPRLRSDRAAVQVVMDGNPAAAPLFTDSQGQIRKAGYVPVQSGDGTVIALVGVEADAQFLGAVRALRARILGIGLAGIVFSLALAAILARGLTQPLDRLVDWARQLGAGNLAVRVPVSGRDEIGFLGETLEQMREHLESRDRELRAMVAGVAHEIRNPLGGMRLYTELIARDKNLAESQRDRLAKVLGELDQLGRIVDEFLLYARPAHPQPEAMLLSETIGELLAWVEPEAAEAKVTIESAGNENVTVLFDRTHFQQVLRNLIGNAVQAAAESEGESSDLDSAQAGQVRLSWTERGDRIELSIFDSGPGIPPDLRERIFEPFYTTKATGAGLGLPIVQRLALLNHAELDVLDADGGGTCFRLRIPEGRKT